MRSKTSSELSVAQDSPQKMLCDYTALFADAGALADFLMLPHEEQEQALSAMASQMCPTMALDWSRAAREESHV